MGGRREIVTAMDMIVLTTRGAMICGRRIWGLRFAVQGFGDGGRINWKQSWYLGLYLLLLNREQGNIVFGA